MAQVAVMNVDGSVNKIDRDSKRKFGRPASTVRSDAESGSAKGICRYSSGCRRC